MTKRPRWVLVAAGVGIVLVFLGIGVAIFVTAWLRENVDVEDATRDRADTQFEEVRREFGGQAPLLLLDGDEPRYTREPGPDAAPIERIYVLAWDPHEEKLARFSVPFWLVRLKSGPIEFGGYAAGLDEQGISIRPADIEKFGPGIIVDASRPSGERVLIWAR